MYRPTTLLTEFDEPPSLSKRWFRLRLVESPTGPPEQDAVEAQILKIDAVLQALREVVYDPES